jgi:sugar-specific transcriptional regulator TrmB
MSSNFSPASSASNENSVLTEETIEVLTSLGLRITEAKIFYALCRLGNAKAKDISKNSEVAREVVYQTMPSLINKGLVEEIVDSPKSFRAIPLKNAYEILHQQREEENRNLYLRYKSVLEKQQNISQPQLKPTQIFLLSSKSSKQFRIDKEYENVQTSLDMTFPVGKFIQWCQFYAEKGLTEVAKRKVRIRVITGKRLIELLATYPNSFVSPQLFSLLKNVEFKYLQNLMPVEMMIFDDKTLFLSTKNVTNINKMQWLYSNNPFLVHMAKSHFQTLWENATE